tara:strand:- start:2752 stop:3336 length:585 start_codon:yes stop_codon:yes gene_type:complete
MTRIETHTQNTLKREQKTRLVNVYESIHRDGEVLVTYTGPLDSNVVESILKLAERSILQKGSSRSEMKQVCKVLIECFQNIRKHGWIDASGETFVNVTLEHNPGGYQIKSRNILDMEMASTLKLKLDDVNGLNLSQLRKRYVDALCRVDSNRTQEAGLGLLGMAERCTGPLKYEITDQDNNDLLIFELTVTVKR